MKKYTQAYIAVIAQSFIIGFSFLFVKVGLRSTDPLTLLAHRFLLASIIAYLYYLLSPQITRIQPTDWLKLLPYSLAYPLAFFVFQTLSLQLISSSEAGIIQGVTPIITLIVARIILKEKVDRSQSIFIGISVLGVLVINLFNGLSPVHSSFLGLGFALLSGVSIAIYNVLTKRIAKTQSVFSIVLVMSIFGCLFLNVIALGRHLVLGTLSLYFEPLLIPSYIGSILYLGILSSFVTSMLLTFALKELEATKVGLFANLATLITILAGTVLLNESLQFYHYLGIIAILTGTIGFNLVKNKG